MDVLRAGLLPNAPHMAQANSELLERMRKSTRHVVWPQVSDPHQPDFCFYYLDQGVTLRPNERWEGSGIYTQLYFSRLQDDALITLGEHSSLARLGLIHYGAFRNGQSRMGAGITDGVMHGQRNARRWRIDNVLVSWCESGVRLHNTWIGSIRDLFVSWCQHGFHVPVGAQALAINVSGGEIGGQNTGYGVFVEGIVVDTAFRSVTIEGNEAGGVRHTGINGKANTVYDGCYFESNGYKGPKGSMATGQPKQLVIDGPNDVGTKIVNCGFHDPGVPSIRIDYALRPEVRNCWFETASVHVMVGKSAREPSISRGTVKFSGRANIRFEE